MESYLLEMIQIMNLKLTKEIRAMMMKVNLMTLTKKVKSLVKRVMEPNPH